MRSVTMKQTKRCISARCFFVVTVTAALASFLKLLLWLHDFETNVSSASLNGNGVPEKQSSEKARPINVRDSHYQDNAIGIEGNRSFLARPVSAQESVFLRDEDAAGITAAVCHRCLFGEIALDRVLGWASYYRLLGFDHMFLWYRPNIVNLSRFEEIQALTYVTLIEYNDKSKMPGGIQEQYAVEKECLRNHTASFNWTMIVDLDEYLWFLQRQSVKQFLRQHSNYHYLSFGKYMYTKAYEVLTSGDTGFELDRYAFTAKSYCKQQAGRVGGNSVCPGYYGRSKIMCRPLLFADGLGIHGQRFPLKARGRKHFNTSDAHLKEWPKLMKVEPAKKTQVHERESFDIKNIETAELHGTNADYKRNADDSVTLHYDDKLQGWFSYVARGCRELIG